MQLSEFVDPREVKREVEIRGAKYTMRMVTAAEALFVRRCLPDPQPPMGPDPTKGSLAPQVPNHQDSAYRRDVIENLASRRAAMVAISLGVAYEGHVMMGPGHDFKEQDEKYVKGVSAAMMARLGEETLVRLSDELEAIDLGKAVEGAAGN